MPLQVIAGATLACSFGAAPAPLSVLPANRVNDPAPAANIMDHKPIVNIPGFGICTSPANPSVAAATAAAMGVLTPMPCMPATLAPWTPGSPSVITGGFPSLNSTSVCRCNWGGVVSVVDPGQQHTLVP
jgi:hypothetical protein